MIAGAYLSGTNTRRVRRALAAAFAGPVGKDVVSRTWRCLPETATRDAMIDALDWLEKESTGLDTALLFLAGHGMTWRRSS